MEKEAVSQQSILNLLTIPFTQKEYQIIELIKHVHKLYFELEIQDESDAQEFITTIRQLQDFIIKRPGMRVLSLNSRVGEDEPEGEKNSEIEEVEI